MTTAPARPTASTRPLPADLAPTFPVRIGLGKAGQRLPLVQQLQSVLYLREVAPGGLGAQAKRAYRSPRFSLALDVFDGGHRLVYSTGTGCATEIVTEADTALPPGAAAGCLCAGDNEAEHIWTPEREGSARTKLSWMTSVQTEQLPEHLFAQTMQEMEEMIRAGVALVHRWRDQRGDCLSMLDVQRAPLEAHVQAYHLIASGGVVLRTQSLFEIVA